MCCASILIEFLKFYCCDFNMEKHAIDISQLVYRKTSKESDFYSGMSIVDKETLHNYAKQEVFENLEHLEIELGKSYEDNERHITRYFSENITQEYESFKYYLLDPFNYTYSPAKNVTF